MRITAIAAACLVALGCASGGSNGDGEFITDFDASLTSRGGSTVTGTARAVASLGRTAVTLEIDGARPGARHPWHVHEGRCGSGGAIVGSASSYPVLEVDEDGSERASGTIDVQLDDDRDYHVNVHASPSDLQTIVACGALVD